MKTNLSILTQIIRLIPRDIIHTTVEFKAFVVKASQDQFGLKVKLPNGNVANRILPVQIHDLYPEDKTLVERELRGILRSIDFIYKEPGVNRPLTNTPLIREGSGSIARPLF